jgi:hypothetical protein
MHDRYWNYSSNTGDSMTEHEIQKAIIERAQKHKLDEMFRPQIEKIVEAEIKRVADEHARIVAAMTAEFCAYAQVKKEYDGYFTEVYKAELERILQKE